MATLKVRVGNYRAPIDTQGMDKEMLDTLNPKRVPVPAPRPSLFSNIMGNLRGMMNSTGSVRSPSTIKDVRAALPRSDAQVEADYQRERAARASRKP